MNSPVVLKPRVSEKVYGMSEQLNTFAFDVPASANKNQVAKAITEQYKVEAVSVRFASVPGKSRRRQTRSARRVSTGHDSKIRKAYVTLKKGETLPIFAGINEEIEHQPEDSAPKENKAAQTASKATAKTANKRGLRFLRPGGDK